LTSEFNQSELTLSKVIAEAKPICVVKQEVGTGNIALVLDWHLSTLARMMNVKHNLDSTQIRIIVNDLIEMFPGESIEDFILCFKKLRQGYYGQSYHLLNESNIIGAFKMHLDEKYAEQERFYKEEKKAREKAERDVSKDEEIARVHAAYRKLIEQGGPAPADPKRQRDAEYDNFRNEWLRKKALKDGNQTKSPDGVNQRSELDALDTPDKPATT
jgi:hypothetical protein